MCFRARARAGARARKKERLGNDFAKIQKEAIINAMTVSNDVSKTISALESAIGYHFKNKALIMVACIHRSFANENRDFKTHNERLEFLGDSILGLLIAEYLFVQLPETPEGELSFLRSRLVEASTCYTFAQKLQLDSFLSMGKGERLNAGRGRDSILADFFEAVIGAIYLDGGLEAARSFIFRHFQKEIEAIIKTPVHNWKALLQDYCQKQFQVTPQYKVLEETGPDHQKHFKVAIFVQDKNWGEGIGSSKKAAQQAAAEEALRNLK